MKVWDMQNWYWGNWDWRIWEPCASIPGILLRPGMGIRCVPHSQLCVLDEFAKRHRKQLGGRKLLVQGDAPRDDLLRRFRDAGDAVLFGTGSFWEGVDVRGQALSVVAIDKLPFASPSDPMMMARLEFIRRQGGNGFDQAPVGDNQVVGLPRGRAQA